MAVVDREPSRLKFKIVLLGDACVGKTSLLQRLLHAEFHTEWVEILHNSNRCTNHQC